MFNRPTRILATCIVSLLVLLPMGSTAQQSDAALAYTATAIHSVPGQTETSGLVVRSDENMRLEFDQNGQKVIQVLLPDQGVMYILDPQSQTYLELSGAQMPASSNQSSAAPCSAQSGMAVCQRVGVDTISGIQVERWLLANNPQTQPVAILWDPTRRHALRQDFPDGSTTALSFVSMEELNGRATEHWALKILAPGQEPLTGGWWFDPEIRVVVREELPGGEIRRLENIVVGPVDPALFQLPTGWSPQESAAIATPQAPATATE